MSGILGRCARCGHVWEHHWTAAPPPDGGPCMEGGTNGQPACPCPKFVLRIPAGLYR